MVTFPLLIEFTGGYKLVSKTMLSIYIWYVYIYIYAIIYSSASYHHLILYDTLFPYNFPIYPQSTVRPCRFQLACRSPPSWPPRRPGRETTSVKGSWGLDQRKSDWHEKSPFLTSGYLIGKPSINGIMIIYITWDQITIWLWLTVCHGKTHHAIKLGKPSISMGRFPWLC